MRRILALLLCTVLLSLAGCVPVVDNTQPRVIAVISKKDGGSFWDSVLAGAEDAGLQNGYGITFRGPETDGPQGVKAQRDLLDLAVSNEAEAIVFCAAGAGFEDKMAEIDRLNIPVVQFDSGLYPKDIAKLKMQKQYPVIASVYTNHYQAGALNAEHLFEAIRAEIARSMVPYAVGVLQHDMSTAGEERAQGFLHRFTELADADPDTKEKYTIQHVKCTSDPGKCYVDALDSLQKKGVRAVFLTNQDAVDQVYDAITDNPHKYDYMVFTGFDSGKKQLAWLKNPAGPRLIGSVAQNPYELGYNAVLQAVNGLEARGVTAFVEIPAHWYDADTVEDLLDRNIISE